MNIIDSYFTLNRYYITKHHLDSYNDFISNTIKKTIRSMNPFIILKKDVLQPNINKHIIEIYIGGENGDEIFIDKPVIHENGKTRIMTPNEARINDFNYSANLYCNIVIKYINNESKSPIIEKLDQVNIGSIPIMLHSNLCYLKDMPSDILREMGECQYDQGGYFIIDGKEKVIVAQERNSTNNLFISRVEKDPKYCYSAFIHCSSEISSVFPKTIKFKVLKSDRRRNAIVVNIPHIETDIPLAILFRALGIENDLAIIKHILPSVEDSIELDILRQSIVDGNFIYSEREAKEYLATFTNLKTVEHLDYILINNLFPNYEHEEIINFNKKTLFLGNLIKQLLEVISGKNDETDRDNYMLKRVGISGFLLGDLFKDFYNNFRVKCRSVVDSLYEYGNWRGEKILEKKINNGNKHNVFQAGIIANGIIKSLKGNWGLTNDPSKQGIVQDLNRLSFMSFISHLRRVTSTMDSSIKIRHPHQLNTSQYGFMCPCESPDGASIGLIKNFAMFCHVTFNVPSNVILEAIEPFDIKYIDSIKFADTPGFQININNNWIGNISQNDAQVMVEYLKCLRQNALINIFISILCDVKNKTINIYTDGGRVCRPLLIVKNKKVNTTFDKNLKNWYELAKGETLRSEEFDIYSNKFIKSPVIFGNSKKKIDRSEIPDIIKLLKKNSANVEFIDVYETNHSLIAMFEKDIVSKNNKNKYSHCEIHPSTMFSVYSACIPLSNHNQAPRNIFSGAQGKQAIGVYATNFNNRIDTIGLLMNYPEKPIVQTRYNSLLKINDLPNGNNLIVAISSYTGYNQEDSIIFNKNSIERGLFNITYLYSHITFESKTNDEDIVFTNPKTLLANGENVDIKKYANYDTIDENGMPILNKYISENDVIVGKCQVIKSKKDSEDLFEKAANNTIYKATPDIADKTVSGFIDKVYQYKNKDNENAVKINIRKFKTPELGDKLASRHGQKGVIGMILPQEDMPRTKDGIVPDIIMNPHAFPSRMTIGHLLECIVAKGCAINGYNADMTPFDDNDFNKYFNILDKAGYQYYGDELLYNGLNGTQIETQIFFGPTYYYRLKHMVSDKINYRNPGKVTSMTRQPPKGRSNEGGLRVGEMETNCLLAHGISSFIKESFNERSDKYSYYIDNDTGLIADVNPQKKIYNGHLNISKVFTPYSYKLFLQELNTMSIDARMLTAIDEHNHLSDEECYMINDESGSESE